ncbi:tRNA pseudouridine synthase A [bacterium HR09]|nr:tRNA pseudouridine synthase A [bacterium HR09]
MEPRLRMTLAYLGTHFAGWQKQENARTVQGELEKALARLYQKPVPTVGAGRTDAGVHADGQVAHFDPPLAIPPTGVLQALNSFLPWDLRVLQVKPVPASFHARRSAVGKRYRYRLAWGAVLPPWEGLRRLWLPRAPNLELLAEALRMLPGEHDFVRFSLSGHAGRGKRGTVRTLFVATLTAGRGRADMIFEGDGFLRGMVRRLVGAALEIAQGRQELSWLQALMAGEASLPPAPTAPPHGLTLERVFYRRPRRWAKGPQRAQTLRF